MTDILRLTDINIADVFFGLLVLSGAFLAVMKIIEGISIFVKRPVKWIQKREKVAHKVEELETQLLKDRAASIEHDQKLEKKIETLADRLSDLTDIVVDDRIDRMRYEILDMASAIAETKRWYTMEQIKHALKTYDEYEEFLEKHNRSNGEIEMSIEIIKKAYRDKYDGMKGASS